MSLRLEPRVWEALRTSFTIRVPGTCFARNEAMELLGPRNIDLVTAIEAVVGSEDFPTAYDVEPEIQGNLRALLKIYFGLADDHKHDTVPFIDRLKGGVFQTALTIVFLTWGPGGFDRRKRIPRNLFDFFCAAFGEQSHEFEIFNRYRRIGILSVSEPLSH